MCSVLKTSSTVGPILGMKEPSYELHYFERKSVPGTLLSKKRHPVPVLGVARERAAHTLRPILRKNENLIGRVFENKKLQSTFNRVSSMAAISPSCTNGVKNCWFRMKVCTFWNRTSLCVNFRWGENRYSSILIEQYRFSRKWPRIRIQGVKLMRNDVLHAYFRQFLRKSKITARFVGQNRFFNLNLSVH